MSRVADYRCDRCGWTDASPVPGDPDRLPEAWQQVKQYTPDRRVEYTWDLCPACSNAHYKWMTTPVDAHNGADLEDGTAHYDEGFREVLTWPIPGSDQIEVSDEIIVPAKDEGRPANYLREDHDA